MAFIRITQFEDLTRAHQIYAREFESNYNKIAVHHPNEFLMYLFDRNGQNVGNRLATDVGELQEEIKRLNERIKSLERTVNS